MAKSSDLSVVEAYAVIRGVGRCSLVSFSFEHNPVGIVPSMGTMELFVKVDDDVEDSLDEFKVPRVPITTAGKNYSHATGKVARSVRKGAIAPPTGQRDAFPVPDEPKRGIDKQVYDSLKRGRAPTITDLLNAEFDVYIQADVATPVNDDVKDSDGEVKETKIRVDTANTGTVFRSLRVKRIEGKEEAPPTLNKIALMEVTFADGRDEWSQLSNFSDDINIFKGVSEIGSPTYENHSIWNPAAAQNTRNAWSPKLFMEYLISLMEGKVISGSRSSGLTFSVNVEDYLVSDNPLVDSEGVYVVENVSERGANPALILRQHLRRWGMDIIFTHDGTWYIDKITRSAVYPSKELLRRATDVMPRSDNGRSLRAKKCVVLGNPIKFQEGFHLIEHEDFDYVVPVNGKWLQMDFVWKRILSSAVPEESIYDDSKRAEYLSKKERETLDLLAAVPPGDDYETWLAEADAVSYGDKGERHYRILLALFSVAENGHRYIRLRKDGVYGELRRPLKNLISVDSSGDGNRPVVISKGWASYKFRVSVSAQKDYSLINKIKGAFTEANTLADIAAENEGLNLSGEIDSKAGQIVGQASDTTVTKTENLNDFIKVDNFPQGCELVDSDALVFRFEEKAVYPASLRSLPDSFAEIAFRSQAAAARRGDGGDDDVEDIDLDDLEREENGGFDSKDKARSAIRHYTDYRWERAKTIKMLLASIFKSAPMSKENTPGGDYYSVYKVQDGYDGVSVQYQNHLDAEVVISRLKIVDGQFAIVGAGGTQNLTEIRFFFDSSSLRSPVDVLRETTLGTLNSAQADSYRRIDDEAKRVAEAYFNSTRYIVGAEYRWFEVINPSGRGPKRREVASFEGDVVTEGISYSTQMKTIMWAVDDSGAGTFVRYNTDDPYNPDVSQYRRQYIEFLNQQRQEHGLGAFNAFRREAERMSGGRHAE